MEKTSNLGIVMGLKSILDRSVEYSRGELSRALPLEGDEVGLSRYPRATESVTAIKKGYQARVDNCFANGEISQRERDSLINESDGGGLGFQLVLFDIRMQLLDHIGCLAVRKEDEKYGLR